MSFPFFPEDACQFLDTAFDVPRNFSVLVPEETAQSPTPSAPAIYQSYKKSKWTPEEDKQLIESVRIHGTKNWISVATLVPDRNSKQCRERWTAQLDPSLNHNEFTPQEDAVIIMQHQANGPLWAKIASYLPGRSSTAIKNRFNWLSRRHLPQKLNRYFSSGTTPMEPSSGSMSSLGLAPFALSDPMESMKPSQKEEANDNIFRSPFYDVPDPNNDDIFSF